MPRPHFATVDDYIASFPAAAQEVLVTIRGAVREAVPDALEVISYQMPAYRLNGLFLYFAAFTNHYSLFLPQPDALLERFAGELGVCEISKATFKFPLDRPVPVDLIRRMAAFRGEEFRARPKPMRAKKG